MRWNRFAYVILAPILYACSRDAGDSSVLTPPSLVTIRGIQALPHEPLGARVQHGAPGTFSIRVQYALVDGSDSAFTPWPSADSSVVVLGLAAGRTYAITVQSLGRWRRCRRFRLCLSHATTASRTRSGEHSGQRYFEWRLLDDSHWRPRWPLVSHTATLAPSLVIRHALRAISIHKEIEFS